jgi:hypothetical protein
MFLVLSIILIAAVAVVACKKQEEKTMPTETSESMQDSASGQDQGMEPGTGQKEVEEVPVDQQK